MSRNARTGDTHVTGVLRANAADLLAYFERRVGVHADAADQLSDLMIVVWRRADRLPADPTQARMWLFGIARRVHASARRARGRRDAATERLRTELTSADVVRAPESDAVDRAQDVAAAIARLPEVLQELVRLIHWDGFTLAEAAAITGASASTVRSRYARARDLLRAELTEHETASAACKSSHARP